MLSRIPSLKSKKNVPIFNPFALRKAKIAHNFGFLSAIWLNDYCDWQKKKKKKEKKKNFNATSFIIFQLVNLVRGI